MRFSKLHARITGTPTATLLIRMAVDGSQQADTDRVDTRRGDRDQAGGEVAKELDVELSGPRGQLLDLLGARLQFEQNGIRLYDQLIAKLETARGVAVDQTSTRRAPADVVAVDDLVTIRNEELVHVRMLDAVITELGGEPAAVTPAASREVIASRGIADIVGDPASTTLDALEAMVVAELADHEQWVGLVELARELGRDDLARSFLTAQSTEHTHLSKMRAWISAGRAASRVEVQ